MTNSVSGGRLTSELSPDKVEAIVQTIVELHHQNGGATVDSNGETLSGQDLYAVGVFIEAGRIIEEQLLPANMVRRFVQANADLLKHPLCVVGSWFCEDENKSYLDISVLIRDRELALEIGKEYNQKAICDLSTVKIIKLGGDGTLPPDKRGLTKADILSAVASRIEGAK